MTSIHAHPPGSSGGVYAAAQPAKLPVRVTGLITADDVIASLKAVGKWRTWRTALFLVPIMLILFSLGAGNRRRLPLLLIFFMIPLVIAILAPLRARWRLKKSWRAHTEYHQPVSWTFSEDGLFVETVNSKSLRHWAGFVYAKITPERIVLAHPGDQMFNFVPRRLFESDAQWVAVCQLLASKVPVKESGWR